MILPLMLDILIEDKYMLYTTKNILAKPIHILLDTTTVSQIFSYEHTSYVTMENFNFTLNNIECIVIRHMGAMNRYFICNYPMRESHRVYPWITTKSYNQMHIKAAIPAALYHFYMPKEGVI